MSVTTPIEYTLDQTGNVKSSRKFPNLRLTRRPSIKPVFANTGQILQRAYAGKAGGMKTAGSTPAAGSVGPLNPMPKYVAGIEESNQTQLPPPGYPGADVQGDDLGGGMVVPDKIAQEIQATGGIAGGEKTGSKSMGIKALLGNKKLLIGGGIVGIAAIIVIYFMFFAKGGRKGRKRKKSKLY